MAERKSIKIGNVTRLLKETGKHNQMNKLDDEWMQFLKKNGIDMSYAKEPIDEQDDDEEENAENVMSQVLGEDKEIKEVTHKYELSISTKTEKLFLNCAIDIDDIINKPSTL